VPGDDPAYIGSGPTVGDDSTNAEAIAIMERWAIDAPCSVSNVLSGATGVVVPGDRRLDHVTNRIVAAPSHSIACAMSQAREAGCEVRNLGDDLEGEARKVARDQAALAVSVASAMVPGDAPVVLLSGGELTVTRTGKGVGGPNAEYALALANALRGHDRIFALACDTDGVDGRLRWLGPLSPRIRCLAANAARRRPWTTTTATAFSRHWMIR